MKAFCDPPITTSRPQPSISSGMVPSPVMASTTRMASVFFDGGSHGPDVVGRAGRSFRSLYENRLGRGFRRQRAFDLLRGDYLTVRYRQHIGFQSVGFGDLRPALSELSGYADDHLVAPGEQVRNRGVHGAGAGGAEHQYIIGGSHHLLEIRQAGTVGLAEILGAMVNVRRHHRVQGRRIKRGRTRCEQALFSNVHREG